MANTTVVGLGTNENNVALGYYPYDKDVQVFTIDDGGNLASETADGIGAIQDSTVNKVRFKLTDGVVTSILIVEPKAAAAASSATLSDDYYVSLANPANLFVWAKAGVGATVDDAMGQIKAKIVSAKSTSITTTTWNSDDSTWDFACANGVTYKWDPTPGGFDNAAVEIKVGQVWYLVSADTLDNVLGSNVDDRFAALDEGTNAKYWDANSVAQNGGAPDELGNLTATQGFAYDVGYYKITNAATATVTDTKFTVTNSGGTSYLKAGQSYTLEIALTVKAKGGDRTKTYTVDNAAFSGVTLASGTGTGVTTGITTTTTTDDTLTITVADQTDCDTTLPVYNITVTLNGQGDVTFT